MKQPPPVLTVGGSDSGGAAGVQADLKTFTAWHVYGMSALTAVTAQNSARVAAIHYLSPGFVASQLDTVLEDYGAAAIKTGFVGQGVLVEVIARRLRAWYASKPNLIGPLVVDPVLVNHRGEAMFEPGVTDAYRRMLLPIATLVTPNQSEAALLTETPITTFSGAEAAVMALVRMGARHVLLKGIHRGMQVVDLFYDGMELHQLVAPRVETTNTHGSGDTLAAAIVAGLARQLPLRKAVELARTYTYEALRASRHWELGAGHGPLAHWAGGESNLDNGA